MTDWGAPPPPSVVVGLLGLQVAYWLCVGPYRNRFRGAHPVPAVRKALFAQGIVVLFLALASPLHVLSDSYLFTAHMVQHLLITLVAAPLLLAGTPGWLLEDALRTAKLLPLVRRAMHPLAAFGFFNLVFAFSHLPGIYELALAVEPLHAAEHALFLLTALLLWLPVLSPSPHALPRYPYLGRTLYVFAQAIPASLVGAFLTKAPAPFYPTYVTAVRITDLSPMVDQQVGALLMWVGGGLYYLVVGAVIFFTWANQEEHANRRPIGPQPA